MAFVTTGELLAGLADFAADLDPESELAESIASVIEEIGVAS